MRHPTALFAALVGLLATPALAQPPGFSGALADTDFQTFTTEAAPSRLLTVAKDKSTAFRLAGAAGKIVVAQPDIAEIVANTDRSIYIRGKALGATNILVYDQSRRLIEVIDVKVGHDLAGIQADLAAALPGEVIKVSNLADGLMLSGGVSTSSVAARARTIAERYAPQAVSSSLTVEAAQQVMLEVRILEASRDSLKDFGINMSLQNNSGVIFGSGLGLVGNNPPQGVLQVSTNVGPTSIDLTLQALEEKGIIRTLARPNLAAISGEEASFLAGGEFPYPAQRQGQCDHRVQALRRDPEVHPDGRGQRPHPAEGGAGGQRPGPDQRSASGPVRTSGPDRSSGGDDHRAAERRKLRHRRHVPAGLCQCRAPDPLDRRCPGPGRPVQVRPLAPVGD